MTNLHELYLRSRHIEDSAAAHAELEKERERLQRKAGEPGAPGQGARAQDEDAGVPPASTKPKAWKAQLYDKVDLGTTRCTNFTMHPGQRLCLPWGTLHRAVTGAHGSTHLTIGLPRYGLSFSDVVLNGFQTPKAIMALWARGTPGSTRRRTRVAPGQCAGGVECGTELMKTLVYMLRHNEDTNGPYGSGLSSARLAATLPMWTVKPYVAKLRADLHAGPEVAAGAAGAQRSRLAKVMDGVKKSGLYRQYQQAVDADVMREMFAGLVSTGGAPATDEDILALFAKISSPVHFVRGLLQVEHVPDYQVSNEPKHCPRARP